MSDLEKHGVGGNEGTDALVIAQLECDAEMERVKRTQSPLQSVFNEEPLGTVKVPAQHPDHWEAPLGDVRFKPFAKLSEVRCRDLLVPNFECKSGLRLDDGQPR